ncbi:hypothetical protein MCEZLEM10_00094 [Methylophilaceae bacterium]
MLDDKKCSPVKNSPSPANVEMNSLIQLLIFCTAQYVVQAKTAYAKGDE